MELRVVGRKMPDLHINVRVEKTLYLDIDHAPLEDIKQYPPTSTYVITNRRFSELDDIIQQGYFNIVVVKELREITPKFIANFVATSYDDNHLAVVSHRVQELYAEYGGLANQLFEALQALRDENAEEFSKIMSFNLYAIIASFEGINDMLAYCESLKGTKVKLSALTKAMQELSSARDELAKYKEMFDNAKAAEVLAQSRLEDAGKTIADLQDKLAASAVHMADPKSSADYTQLQASLEAIKAERDNYLHELTSLKENIDDIATLSAAGGRDNLVSQLKQEIKKLKETSYDQIIAQHMPVFQSATTLAAEKILYFKEVRPAVYINTLIYWLNSKLSIQYRTQQRKSYLIVVFDPLTDQYSKSKYEKHGWCINTKPRNEKESILITNVLDYSKLKRDYGIDTYQFLIVIDRMHIVKDAVELKLARKFYLINTCNDITDFGLDPASCIGFMSAVSSSTPVKPKYIVPTWHETLSRLDSKERAGKWTDEKTLDIILSDMGVLPK